MEQLHSHEERIANKYCHMKIILQDEERRNGSIWKLVKKFLLLSISLIFANFWDDEVEGDTSKQLKSTK